ncbi:glutathione S-transferase family protein [Frigidibacter sp. RF13]|uniref:glutathione S-transferase family protein n=1 Tax=Frigidibacter sp. RF13 TaxID=2997340 RepID=UPI00226E8ADF|nr:glutathione S-transferase family protein [Frigidibacter sp. RF13]MCY1126930.1 glutathione S-transferase family protein [Frigidibacter sp. RF13]
MYVLHYAPDLSSLIVRLALEEMGLDYRDILVDFDGGEHHGAAYRAINPTGLIPVLETPAGPIFETGAILLWLSETHGQLAPPPGDPDRAGFLKWLFFAANTLHADLRARAYATRYSGAAQPGDATEQAFVRAVETRMLSHLDLLEALAAQGWRWFSPDRPSLLPLYVACILRWLRYFPGERPDWFRLVHYPALTGLLSALERRPAVLRAARKEGLGATIFTDPVFG